MRLSPRPVRTGRFWTAPAAFPPPQPDRPPTDRQIPHLRLPATLRNSPHPTLRTPHHIGGGLHQHPHFPLHLDAGQHPEPPNAEQNRSRFDTVNHDLWPPLSAVSCNHQEQRGHGSHHGISRPTRRPYAPHSSRRAEKRLSTRFPGRLLVDPAVRLTVRRVGTTRLSGDEFGAGWRHDARVLYASAYGRWHRSTENAAMVVPVGERRFARPHRFAISSPARLRYDVVFYGDWRSLGGPQHSMLAEIEALLSAGARVAVC